MLRMLFFLLIALVANPAYGQGVNDDFLDEGAGSASGSIDTGFLDEGDETGFDPMGELDAVKSSRIEKRLEATKSAKKEYDSRMAEECDSAFNDLWLEVVDPNDTRTVAERKADEERARRARKQKKSLCWRWFCSGGANSAEEIQSAWAIGIPVTYGVHSFSHFRASEVDCPGGKIRQGGDGEGFYQQLEALEAELDEERAIEERLRQQRRADAERKRKARIAADEARQEQILEQSRQRAAAAQAEREAEQLAWCQEAWSQGRKPCGCGSLPGAPVCVGPGCTCGK